MALQRKVAAAFFAASLLLASCAGEKQYLKSGYRPPSSVAILPMDNHTNDLNGPDIVRYWFNQRLAEKKGYQTVPLETIDAALKELGISEGGQLPAVKPETLGQRIGAEALIYGDLLQFDYQTTGFLNVRKVKAHYRMVDARTGELLWEGEGLGANSEGSLTGAGALVYGVKSLGTQAAEKAMNSPLRTEIWDMIWNAIEYLPSAR